VQRPGFTVMHKRLVLQSLSRAALSKLVRSQRYRRGFATLALMSGLGLAAWSSPAAIVQHLGLADPLVSAGLALAYGPARSTPALAADAPPVRVELALERALHELDERFLSVAIDTSQLVGGHWWSQTGRVEVGRGAQRTAPFDFARPELLQLARALAPAYLRIGGTEADHLFYAFDGQAPGARPPRGYELSLEPARWDALQAFASAAGFDLFFTLNAGPGPRAGGDAWQPDNAEALLRHARDAGHRVSVFELGNEVNGYWFIHGIRHQIDGARYSEDLATARQLVKRYFPEARLAGPGNLFWPIIGEPMSSVFGLLQGYLQHDAEAHAGGSADIVSWHYYPQQSRRCPIATRRASPQRLLDPAYLDEMARWGQSITGLRDRHAPHAEVWLGETGNAQCGGEPGVSDRFVAGLWWLDQLALAARGGQRVVIRQTLIGSDYGLLDADTYRPNPDYYNSLLWKKLMGARVLGVNESGDNPYLRVYAHCTPRLSGGVSGADDPSGGQAVTVLALNTHPDRAAHFTLDLGPSSAERSSIDAERLTIQAERYDLSAPALDSREVSLNGRPLELAGGAPPELHGELVTLDDQPLALAPASYAFLVLQGVRAPACER
jgi:heparanase 1